MKYKLLRFSLLSMLVMLFGGVSSVWADDTSGTIKFGNDDVKINSASVTGNDNLGNTWTITTVGTSSFSSNKTYYQVGKKDEPATSITFTTTLAKEVNVTSLSAKFGGFNNTAGDVSLKVDNTEVGSGSLNASNDVTVKSTKSETGKVLTVSITNIDKGVKCYYISYTYNDQTDQRVKTSIVFADGYATEGMEFTTIDLPTATVKDANDNMIEGAAITWTSSNEEVATISGTQINLLTQGTTVIKATYAGDETAYRGSEKSYTLTVTETDQIANPYVYVFEKKTFDENDLTKKLKNVTWTVTTDAGYFGYDTNDTQKGQQFGSGTAPAKSLKLTLSDIPGTITSIKVNTSGAKDIAATFGIKVGETSFQNGEATEATLASEATDYTFTGSASGDVVISYTQTSSVAIYIKSIEITYKTETEEQGWRDIKADLTSESLLPEGAKQWDDVSTGIAVAADGTLSRVAKEAENAEAIFNGKWHGTQYGWANFSATVKVEGCVKITLGQNNYGMEAIVKDAKGNVVAKIDNKVEGKVWSPNNPADLISVGYYRINEPTTLTLEYGSYLGYFAVEAINPADLPEEITEYTITFDKGEVEGIAPTTIKVESGKTATIPANRTLWVEGKTLTAWTDGTNQYAPGSEISPTADMTLTPVFTENATSFDKRTTEVTALWDFTQKTGGAPLIAIEGANNSSAFVVTQIDVNGSTIDFRFDVDATSGKFNNSNGEWCQINSGAKFTLPAYKGAQYTIYSMGDSGDATFNGETGAYANNNTSYTYNGDAESMEIVIGTGTWFKTLTAVYPVPEQQEEPTESIVYSWEGNKDGAIQTGGTASATDATGTDLTADDINIANSTFYVMRVRGAKDFSTNVINIALEKALKTGDKIAITAYRNKNAADKQTGALLKFEKGEATVSTATSEKAGLEFVNIDTSDDSAADQNRGTEPNTVTLEVPADAAGSKTITMTRAITGTNLFITKIVITTTGESGDEPEEPAGFTFRDFNTELNTLLTDNDGSGTTVTFGLSVAEDGAVSRVAADAENTAAIVTGKTGNNHGLQNFSATVPVEGAVKITMGTCSWGGEVTVKNAENETVATFTTKKGENGAGCYKGNKFDDENIVSAKYVGDATTLTISGGAYVNFFAVEAIEASSVDVAYSLGEVECEGDILPTGGTFAAGDEYTIPAKNFTLYKDGYTLTGWSDGKNTYAAGEKITLSESITLTPVFTQNEVSLADRTEPVTVKWNFRRDQGAPILNYQNKDGILVAQATIGNSTIDVKMPFTTNNGGKLNNQNNNDCAQCNNNTTFAIPSCKNAVVSMESYGGDYIFKAEGKTATTIDGQNDYEGGQNISYTIGNTAETIDIVMGNDAGFIRTIQVVLPVVQSAGGETFDNVEATIIWPMDEPAKYTKSSVTPDGVFSTVSVNLGDVRLMDQNGSELVTGTSTVSPGITFSQMRPTNDASDYVTWVAKPAAGLTFTPKKITAYIVRFGTDAQSGVTFSAKVGDGEPVSLGTFTAPRNNKSQAEDKFGSSNDYAVNGYVEIELTEAQQQAFTSGETFSLMGTIGVGNSKAGGIATVTVTGVVNGTKESVDMYTLTLAANPEEAGSVSAYPQSDEYEAGSEVTLTATENFGYDFVNWTNAAGEEVSTEAKFKYTVNSNETLTANFVAVETYKLAVTVDGTNDYMVTVSPAPEVVEGKWMYEAGTTVELTANQYEGLVTFTNWNDGETNSSKLISMDADTELTAYYAQADIIAGWDFYTKGGEGRKADFAAQDNEADALSLVNTETGETSGWLDKSTEAAGGYESFKGAAVNWRDNVGTHHWQTKVNAEAFENINVQFQMLYNYNSYQKYNAEYSFDGETWVNFGSITMEGAKNAASFSEKLPEACNNKAELYIRMIADKNSEIVGAAGKDGNALAMFFITGTPKLKDDGKAPVLVSTVPANNATGVSASGKIVLTFDERVKVVEGTMAYINNPEIKSNTQNPTTPTVSGKVVTFEYKGLDYATEYNFVLAGKTVGDLTDNMIQDDITIKFTTMERPTVDKKLYDAVVENVEQLVAAISAAQNRADKNVRFRIFLKKGTYTLPQGTADKTFDVELANGSTTTFTKKDPITYFNAQNVSMIGEDRDATIITNTIPADDTFEGKYGPASIYEGIGKSDVFQLSGSDSYWQDLTVSTGMEDARGRDIAVEDKGTRTIWKNTKLHGYQDTWVGQNDNGLYYFEDGVIRGRTDYICGKGDAYYNQVEFQQIAGGYCAVPSKPANIGWVMKDCTINGDGSGVDGNYTLGRPWGQGTPVALWIDTKMNVVPSAIGWNEMSGGWPARFAEYNSMTSTGSQVDLSGRKKTFGDGHANNPVLTAAEALNYSDKSKMFGEWQPTLATEQAPIVTDVKLTDNELSWTGSNYALLYAIVKNGEVIDFTTKTTYNISTAAGSRRSGSTDQYQIRAANEMGGLNEASEVATETDGIETVNDNVNVNLNDNIYNLQGIRVNKAQKGVYIIGGRKVVIK